MPGIVFSVTIGTSPQQSIFDDVALGRECIDLLSVTLRRFEGFDFAHCLMPDHVHLLLAVGRGSLVDLVADWKARCYHARRRRGEPRPFWQRSFWDHGMRAEEGLYETALYILHNPVRAGLGSDWRDYPLAGSAMCELRG